MKQRSNTPFSQDPTYQQNHFNLQDININHTIEQIFKRYQTSQDTMTSGMYSHARKEIESLQKWVFKLHDLNVDLRQIEINKIYDKILSLYEDNYTEQAEHAQDWLSELYLFVNEKYDETHQKDGATSIQPLHPTMAEEA